MSELKSNPVVTEKHVSEPELIFIEDTTPTRTEKLWWKVKKVFRPRPKKTSDPKVVAPKEKSLTPSKTKKDHHVRVRITVFSGILSVVLLLVVRESFPAVAEQLAPIYQFLDSVVLPLVNWIYKIANAAFTRFFEANPEELGTVELFIRNIVFGIRDLIEKCVGLQ